MDLLQGLMGGGPQRDEYQDFVNRYERGAPHDGISDREAMDRYSQVTRNLSPEDYEMSAEESFARMDPRERAQFAQMLSQQSRQQGMRIQDLDGDGVDDRYQDPRFLAQTMGRMQRQQPGFVEQLLGGAMGGGAMGGGMPSGMMGGGAGNPLANPLARAALGGIAAMAAKRMMGGGGGQRGGGNPFGGGGGIRM